MARILDYKDYTKLKNLLQGSEEDANLAVEIINNCDVKLSFPWIISLISQRKNETYAMASHVCKSINVCEYINKLTGGTAFPLQYNLDFFMQLLKRHEDNIKSEVPKSIVKIIINDYVSLRMEDSSFFDFKPVLKPKKNISKTK